MDCPRCGSKDSLEVLETIAYPLDEEDKAVHDYTAFESSFTVACTECGDVGELVELEIGWSDDMFRVREKPEEGA